LFLGDGDGLLWRAPFELNLAGRVTKRERKIQEDLGEASCDSHRIADFTFFEPGQFELKHPQWELNHEKLGFNHETNVI